MTYHFQFRDVLAYWPSLLDGIAITLMLAVSGMAGGLLVGILGAAARLYGPRPLRLLAVAYVEAIRNTPLLVQLFLVFFGLPQVGVRLDAPVAAIATLIVNVGAYATEIVRAGLQAIPRTQVEAGLALGLSGLQVFRHVVLFPALRMMFPALASQFILQLLGSSIVSAIAAEELTAIANNMVMQTFRNFEIYIVVAVIYFVTVQAFILLFRLGAKLLFRWKQ